VADPRFFTNRGPFRLSQICSRLGVDVPSEADANRVVADIATIESAGSDHLVFCDSRARAKHLAGCTAGLVLGEASLAGLLPASMPVLYVPSAIAAFVAIAELFYPEHGQIEWDDPAISPQAILGESVRIAPGATVAARAEIGDRTRIGPNAVIGPGVAIGHDCDIGSNVSVTHAYLGDEVQILPGAHIGQPGFGFAAGAAGHAKVPQLGRVIVQDRVEIGSGTTIDRGALGDTVIGEGSKIDNLVQIGHNCIIGRHCVIVGQAGLSGSCELGDFVVLGGQVGLADHVRIGDRARLAARGAVAPGELPGGQDYGGAPAIPVREWRRQMAAFAMLGRRKRN